MFNRCNYYIRELQGKINHGPLHVNILLLAVTTATTHVIVYLLKRTVHSI